MFKARYQFRDITVLSMVLAILLVGLPGCDRGNEVPKAKRKAGPAVVMAVESQAFTSGQSIPRKYTGDGKDLSPPLSWSRVPQGTEEFALIVDDPDAPGTKPWVHWVIYKIPSQVRRLVEGLPTSPKLADPAGALQGRNSWRKIGYRGPAPPRGHGVHHYRFTIYALRVPLELKEGLYAADLLKAISSHVLAKGELIGLYHR